MYTKRIGHLGQIMNPLFLHDIASIQHNSNFCHQHGNRNAKLLIEIDQWKNNEQIYDCSTKYHTPIFLNLAAAISSHERPQQSAQIHFPE